MQKSPSPTIQPAASLSMTRSELYKLRDGATLEAIADGENYVAGSRAELRIEDNYDFRSYCLYIGKKFIGFLTRGKWRVIENPTTADRRYKDKIAAMRKANANQEN